MKQIYKSLIFTLLIFSGSNLCAQEPLTDRIVIEFMKPGDKDAVARGYNLVPWLDEAKEAAYKAAEIWASYLEITVPIRVKMGWCDNITTSALGGAMYSSLYTDGYYYPYPLINQLLGYDKNTDTADIICVFNSKLDIGWYFKTDGGIGITPDPNDPNSSYFQKDLLTSMLHEICHGLGIGGDSFTLNSGIGAWGESVAGKASIYEVFICDKEGNLLIDESHYKNGSEALAAALISEDVYWKGTKATENNEGKQVKIYAPGKWTASSISHIDKIYKQTANNLMAGVGMGGGSHQFNPGPIVLGMLQDIGWTVNSNPTANETISLMSSVNVYASAEYIHINNANIGDLISIYEVSGRAVYNGKITSDIMEIPAHCTGVCIVKVGKDSFKVKL